MSHISARGTREKNGVTITRLVLIPKNKYSKVYMEHKHRMDNKEELEVPISLEDSSGR